MTLTMICMGPLVAGRKWWEKEDWSLSLPIIATECNDTIIGNNILLLNREFKELVHEHLALFIYLFTYLCLGDHEHVPGPDSCESLPSS